MEGVITGVKEQLRSANPFALGDSADAEARAKLTALIDRLDQGIGLTLVLDDAAGNSWCSAADEVLHYERTFDQNEELGINDMRVEGYEEEQEQQGRE